MCCWGGIFDLDTSRKKLQELEQAVADPDLWSNQDKAKKMLQEKSNLEASLKQYYDACQKRDDVQALFELAEEMNDEATYKEAVEELAALHKLTQKLETAALLGDEADGNNAYLEIHPGAGGTESQDWASILLRMYIRWAERNGFKVELMEESKGDEAGIKSATIYIAGLNAYGLAKTEIGVHRLVRVSPFDSNARRHTSFASVFVYPEVDDSIEITIDPSDLRIDTYRASGAGGQHVNTTDSAIRITHNPSGIVVTCQQDRSQHRNKEIAMNMLKARLYEFELRKQQAEKDAKEAEKTDIAWGHQIRSYVLHPYKMVKDLRTQEETSNTDAVLDGDIDVFIQAALAQKVV